MDPLARRRLGLTEVEVTQLGFGGAGLGDLIEVIPEAQAAATLQAARDAGIRYYDTAPWYGLTQSEHRFGRALYRRPRPDFVLSTKVGRTMHAVHHAETYDRGIWAGGLPFQVRFDYGYDGVMRSFEDSLQRLGLPRIDLLVIHDLDIQYHQTYQRIEALLTELHNGGARALAELRAAGRIGGFGAGINELGMIPRFLDLIEVDFFLVALPYTLLDQQVLDSEFPRCAEKGVGFVIGAVFASGILATGAVQGARYAYAPATPEMLANVARIEAVCARHDVPLAASALQFPLGHPSVASVIPGGLSPEHVRQNVAAFRTAGALGGAETRRPAAGRRTNVVARGRGEGIDCRRRKVRAENPGAVIAAKALRRTGGQQFRAEPNRLRIPPCSCADYTCIIRA
jgi:D-threo-aldose 1-dehydrogenase